MARRRKTNSEYNRLMDLAGGNTAAAPSNRNTGNASGSRQAKNTGSARNDAFDQLMRQAGGSPSAQTSAQPRTYAQQKSPADIAIERLIGTRAANYQQDSTPADAAIRELTGQSPAPAYSQKDIDALNKGLTGILQNMGTGLFDGAETGVNGTLNQGMSGALKNMGAGLFQGAET